MKDQKERLIQHWQTSGIIKDEDVIEAFRKVPREHFIPAPMRKHAYDDDALPLFEGQTISQPTTVMIMTQALEVKEGMKVLEVGSGSGYQAALLSKLVGPDGFVITTEILPSLYKFAKSNLRDYKNVEVLKVDGMLGYEKEALYDRIIITAACSEVSTELQQQLKIGGVLVAPVGSSYVQHMTKMKNLGSGWLKEPLGDFLFVPVTGKYRSKKNL